MRRLKLEILLFVFALFWGQAEAQVSNLKPKKMLVEVTTAYQKADYISALKLSEQILAKSANNSAALYWAGRSAALLNQNVKAIDYFFSLLSKEKKYPDVRYYYATALKAREKYPEAIREYDKFLQNYAVKDNGYLYQMAVRQIMGSSFALEVAPRNAAAFNAKNVGVLAKNLKIEDNKSDLNAEKRIVLLTKLLNNGEYSILGEATFTEKMDAVYATLAPQNDPQNYKIYRADIVKSEIKNVRPLNAYINLPAFTNIYPALATTSSGQITLYFSSDRPGGFGKKDIWFSVQLSTGDFTQPSNVGAQINSSEDEITPFYDTKSERLYYSSLKPEGIGGFDNYFSDGFKRFWSRPINLGMPFNSGADDYSYRIISQNESYFTSNRAGERLDNDENMVDVYVAKDTRIPSSQTNTDGYISINGSVLDKISHGLYAANCSVSLYQVIENSTVLVDRVDASNYNFTIEKGKTYVIEAEGENINSSSLFINSAELYSDSTVVRDIYIESK